MTVVKVLMVEPGPRAHEKKLDQVHGVLFDHESERAYVEPGKRVQSWELKGGRLVRRGRLLLLARDQDIPPEIPAGPGKRWRSTAGPSRWDARNKLMKAAVMRSGKGLIGNSKLENMAVLAIIAAVLWMAFGAGMFSYREFDL